MTLASYHKNVVKADFNAEGTSVLVEIGNSSLPFALVVAGKYFWYSDDDWQKLTREMTYARHARNRAFGTFESHGWSNSEEDD